MADLKCDVAVIGAGTAGLAAQKAARDRGADVLLIDDGFPGTTCASVGCMPSKLLIAAADAAHAIPHAAVFGIDAQMTVDGPAVMRRLRAERDRFVQGVKNAIARIPEDMRLDTRAKFTGPQDLTLADGRRVTARTIVIATGSYPARPAGFDTVSDHILTNDNIFEMADLPGSVAVLGAGPLGLEMAQALTRLGVRTAVFDLGDRVAGLQDAAVSAKMAVEIGEELALHLGTQPEVSAEGAGDTPVRLRWNGQSEDFEKLLLAVGRPPNLEGLGLAATGLALDDHGLPKVDPNTLQCGDAPIFMAGDVNHLRPLLHEASHEGAIAGTNAARFPDITPHARHVPLAIAFTRPEAATVGEVPAPDDDDYAAAEASYDDQGRARTMAQTGGLCRLYARRSDGRLTGASLCAPGAEHLAHMLAWAIEAELTVGAVLDLPFYHPTLAEGLKPALRALCRETGQDSDPTRRADGPCA